MSETKMSEKRELVLSGSGKFTEALQQPHIFEKLQKYNGQQTEVERTITGGWAVFVIVKGA